MSDNEKFEGFKQELLDENERRYGTEVRDKEYHKGLGEMYVADERFRANYDKIALGCTEFLRDAINVYCDN